MPVRVQKDLPARMILESENIFMIDEESALSQGTRPLAILILNLMPEKEEMETQMLRALSNTPLQVDCTFMAAKGGTKSVLCSQLNRLYVYFDEIKEKTYDGMIITGAPLEHLEFEESGIWNEIKAVMEWSKTHVTGSVMHIGWGAQAGLYYHYGIPKGGLENRLWGIYRHKVLDKRVPLVRCFDDYFMAPHMRTTQIDRADLEQHQELVILAVSKEAGVFLTMSRDGKRVFVQGHPEYDRMTLDDVYQKELKAGLEPQMPYNYYAGDDPDNVPPLTWRAHSNMLFANWLNYYVFQRTI